MHMTSFPHEDVNKYFLRLPCLVACKDVFSETRIPVQKTMFLPVSMQQTHLIKN